MPCLRRGVPSFWRGKCPKLIRSSAPLLIAETAVGTTPDRKSQIGALFTGVRAKRLAGVVWFDESQHSGLYHQDWRLEDAPSALAAFTAAVAGT